MLFSDFRLWAAGCVLLVGASVASAGTITVTNIPTNTTNFGYLSSASNSDNLLVDLDDATGETINGAVFTGDGGTAAGNGSGGVSWALTGPNITAYPSSKGFNSGATDTNVAHLLSDFYYGGSNRTETLTVNGLTPGNTATITVLGAAFGAGSTSGREESIAGSDGTTLANYEENNGEFSTLAYTALVPSSGTLSLTSTATDTNGDTLHYYGFTVSQSATPEPTSLVLLALGSLGVLSRPRRTA